MTVLTVTIPDDLLEPKKSADELAEDVRMAVLMFWLARGMLRPARTTGSVPSAEVDVRPVAEAPGPQGHNEVRSPQGERTVARPGTLGALRTWRGAVAGLSGGETPAEWIDTLREDRTS